MKVQVVTINRLEDIQTVSVSAVDDPGLSYEAQSEGKYLLEMSAKSLDAPAFVRFGPAKFMVEIEIGLLRRFLDETEEKVRESHTRPPWTPSEEP